MAQQKFSAVLKDINGTVLKTVEFLSDDLGTAREKMKQLTGTTAGGGHNERGAATSNTWSITYTTTTTLPFP